MMGVFGVSMTDSPYIFGKVHLTLRGFPSHSFFIVAAILFAIHTADRVPDNVEMNM